MSNLVKIVNLDSSILENSQESGKKLYKQNKNYRDIANLMEHPEFREFYNTHFTDWYDIKTIVMFLKLYEEIEKRSSISLSGYQKIDILDRLIKNEEIRHKICKESLDSSNHTLSLSNSHL